MVWQAGTPCCTEATASPSRKVTELTLKLTPNTNFQQFFFCWFSNSVYIAIAQAVSRRLPTAAARVQTRSGHVGFCGGQKWRWGGFSPRTSVFPTNLHSICFSKIIFTITRGWHHRPGVAAVPIASQTKKKAYYFLCIPVELYGVTSPCENLTSSLFSTLLTSHSHRYTNPRLSRVETSFTQ
jgi:hypothetical protein